MAYDVALREEAQKRGATVTWQGAGKPIKVTYGGRTYDITDYQIKDGKAFVPPSALAGVFGYQPVRQSLGGQYEVGWDPATRQVKVTEPFMGKSATIAPQAVWGGVSYASPDVLEQVRKQLATPSEKAAETIKQEFEQEYVPGMQQASETYAKGMEAALSAYERGYADAVSAYRNEVRAVLGSYMETMNQLASRASDAALQALHAYQQQFSQAVELLRQYMNRSPEIPMSVKLALEEVKKAVDENAKALAEEMNRRGILQSGIALEEERKLREKGLTEQEKILAQWLDQENENMMRAVFTLASMYASSAGPLAELQYRAGTAPLEYLREASKAALQAGTSLAQTGLAAATELAGKRFGVASDIAAKQYETTAGLLGKQLELGTELTKWQAEREEARARILAEQRARAYDAQIELLKLAQQWALKERDWEEVRRLKEKELDLQRWKAQLQAETAKEIARTKAQSGPGFLFVYPQSSGNTLDDTAMQMFLDALSGGE